MTCSSPSKFAISSAEGAARAAREQQNADLASSGKCVYLWATCVIGIKVTAATCEVDAPKWDLNVTELSN